MQNSLVRCVIFCLVLATSVLLAPIVSVQETGLSRQASNPPTSEAPIFTPLFPSVVIRNSFLQNNGIGVYVGFGMEGRVAILNSTFVENAEAIRLLGATSLIRGNEFRENLVGIKVQNDLIYQGRQVTFEVAPSLITKNNFKANREFAVLNLTSVSLNLNDNFWGDARGPTRADPIQQFVQQAAAVLWFAPAAVSLTVSFIAANPAVLFHTEYWVITMTLQTTLSPSLAIPLILTRSVEILADQGERVQGPAALHSWRENPVQVEAATNPSR
jgi:hypothetical protein